MFRKSPIGSVLKNREPTVKLRRDIDPRSQIQLIEIADVGQERKYRESVALNWKERRRIRRAA